MVGGLNLAAIAAFLELQTLSFVGFLAAIFDMLVVGILLRDRWWFQWRPPDEREASDRDRDLEPGPERA